MTFSFEIDEVGGGYVNMQVGEQKFSAMPSYITDALGDFIRALNALVADGEAKCAWTNEPGTIWWQMSRLGPIARILVISIEDDNAWFEENGNATYSSADGEILIDCTCDINEFAALVVESTVRLKETYKNSFNHPFPETEINQLAIAARGNFTTG